MRTHRRTSRHIQCVVGVETAIVGCPFKRIRHRATTHRRGEQDAVTEAEAGIILYNVDLKHIGQDDGHQHGVGIVTEVVNHHGHILVVGYLNADSRSLRHGDLTLRCAVVARQSQRNGGEVGNEELSALTHQILFRNHVRKVRAGGILDVDGL